MFIPFLVAKIHNATVTGANLKYSGSISIDPDIIEKAGLRQFQKVEIYNTSTGGRFSTYIINGESGKKQIELNGAAARMVSVGDKIIIAAYALLDERELNSLSAVILIMNDDNDVEKVISGKL
jgi:aspartate 1-decarboxylase